MTSIPPPLVGMVGLVLWLNEDHVVLDVAVLAEAEVNDATAVAGAQVAAHPVVVEPVEVRAGAEADAARTCRGGREQLVAHGGVLVIAVVVHVDVHVVAVTADHVRDVLVSHGISEDRVVTAIVHRQDDGTGIRPGRR